MFEDAPTGFVDCSAGVLNERSAAGRSPSRERDLFVEPVITLYAHGVVPASGRYTTNLAAQLSRALSTHPAWSKNH